MGIKQKGLVAQPNWGIAFLVSLALLLSLLTSLLISSNSYATGNCSGNLLQGVAGSQRPDVNKCYNPNNTPTNEVPKSTSPSGTAGTTTPAPGSAATPSNVNPGTTTAKGETCAVAKIGWILCPVMEGAAEAADKAFNMLAGRFLEVEPELLSTTSGTKEAWGSARNIANVMFIIAFVVIIYSQITGSGLNNYGIKRMIPRLILAVIAVNLSFYICQGMVDLSNLLGYNIKDGLDTIADRVGPNVFALNTQGLNTETGNVSTLTVITSIGLAAAAVWFFIALGASVIGLVLITAIVIVIILLLRKAILILLVVISPIAFVMYLLPNTEKLFNKWLSMFWKLLMVFPVVALLFGGGHLASSIVLTAGTQGYVAPDPNTCNPEDPKIDPLQQQNRVAKDSSDYNNIIPCAPPIGFNQLTYNPDGSVASTTPKSASISLGLVATGIAVAPLIAVWSVLQGALSAAGAVGGKISGAVQKGTARGVGGATKKVSEAYKGSSIDKMRSRNKRIREGKIRSGAYDGRNPIRKGRSRLNNALNNVGGGYGDQRGRDATAERATRAREKAEEYAGAGNYDDKFKRAIEDYNGAKNGNARDEALMEMNAAMLAASRLDDRDSLESMRPLMKDAQGKNKPTEKAIPTSEVNRVASYTRGSNSAATAGAATGGTDTSSAATSRANSAELARLSFNSTGTNGSLGPKLSGRDVLNQVGAAGGIDKVSTESLVNAAGHAGDHLGAGGADVGHEELGTQAVEELARRGLDANGRDTGRGPGTT